MAINFLTEEATSNSLMQSPFFHQAKELFEELINGKHVEEKLSKLLMENLHNERPLERILDILSVDDKPIPYIVPQSHLNKRKRPWSHIEDNRLLAAVHKLGTTDWESVAKFVGNGRTRPQCSQRWKRALDPRITKDPWTPAEEQKLIDLVREHGAKGWGKISLMMGSRSDLQCRYRYDQIKKQRGESFIRNSSNNQLKFIPLQNGQVPPLSFRNGCYVPKEFSIDELLSRPNKLNPEPKKLDSIACILMEAGITAPSLGLQANCFIPIN
ncbi:Myb-like DNA-binding domain containing protein [Histomonas meleagridis]|uniref:Myb-like DNA-binding domain containing protein n=1 Tax=Histomonas meleagridis TaxID=135588 RepID=UPI003559C265|nr:Myb-like DNA-binding domain containing protein [Histomonas meleagridis]KAH0805544.1 Myb-like DNA-binding domain containing protein [Histomonas meleagridis]